MATRVAKLRKGDPNLWLCTIDTRTLRKFVEWVENGFDSEPRRFPSDPGCLDCNPYVPSNDPPGSCMYHEAKRLIDAEEATSRAIARIADANDKDAQMANGELTCWACMNRRAEGGKWLCRECQTVKGVKS